MSQAEPWDDTRVTSMVVTVSYSHELEGWMASYRVHFREKDQPPVQLGHASIGFGPFDGATEVGYWLAGLTKVLKPMTTVPKALPSPDSPAGNDSGRPPRGGR